MVPKIDQEENWHYCESDFGKISSADRTRILRHIPDSRDRRCPRTFSSLANYDEDIKVSIIITYHNESLSTLLTTIYSIYRRTPSQYLQEIIIIDDYSDDDSTFKSLTEFTCPPFNNHTLLRLQRHRQRWGLIKSRNMGAVMARGNYLMFMDSHSEVNQQWLESLLHVMLSSAGGKMAVSPMLDNIDAETGEYKTTEASIKGGFDWNLHFHWIARDNILNPFTTFRSPTFAGGVFLISRNWFFKLKAFNTRLEVWGGESLEFSLKLWLCGSEIRIVPCSRVGHIFRKEHIFKFPDNDGQGIYLRNSKIIAETWLDHYKYNFYNVKPEARNIPVNISRSEINNFKESLQCNSFDWYLNNVFPELRIGNNFTAYGTISTSSDYCLHQDLNETGDAIVMMSPCSMVNITKWFLVKSSHQLQSDKGHCLSLKRLEKVKLILVVAECSDLRQQKWLRSGLQLRNLLTRLCVEITVDLQLTMNPCRREAPTQHFRFYREIEFL
ncbi:putative polypeptide N-acetylgalactosaminyltransferase 13 [Musca vetustissima]|uniref:putative polypeptide N-acetylgalactosaminyltransferase 13 n=1 Tax=Musca vetustissima TaxID=27455 RepID=UPI002AB6AD7B|nr:putative polypeptide N-acetylgalactosaminyltransferase 13 [Musca vetustissima]